MNEPARDRTVDTSIDEDAVKPVAASEPARVDSRADTVVDDGSGAGGDGAASSTSSRPGRWQARSVGATLLAVASMVCGISLITETEEATNWLLRVTAAVLGLLASWIYGWHRKWPLLLGISVAGLGLAVLGFSAEWKVLAWPAVGFGAGAAGAWSYAHKHRAAWTTVMLASLAYGVSSVSSVLAVTHDRGHWWVIVQGLCSLGLGAVLLTLAARRKRGLVRTRLKAFGKALMVIGVVLPYSALALVALFKNIVE